MQRITKLTVIQCHNTEPKVTMLCWVGERFCQQSSRFKIRPPPPISGFSRKRLHGFIFNYFYRHRNRGAHSIKSEREKELIIKIILRSPEKAETESSSRNSDKRYGDREAPHQTSRQQDRQRHAQTYTHTHTRGGRERESRFQYTALSWGHRPAAGDTASRHLAVATGWALYTREARRLPTLQQSDYITGFSH